MSAKVAVLTAVLGNFDTLIDPKPQSIPFSFHRWTDENFPPCVGYSPRLQYRIPKTHGFEMYPGFEYYMWLDGTVSLKRADCLEWYLSQLKGHDIAFFDHPQRHSIKAEVDHIDDHLKRNRPYITPRYKGGLHNEQYEKILKNSDFKDDRLYATTAFIYRNSGKVRRFMRDWWYEGSRHFTCDQVVVPYLLWKHKLKVKTLDEPIYKSGYISLVTHHK